MTLSGCGTLSNPLRPSVITETVAIAPKPDLIPYEQPPLPTEGEASFAYAARLLAWGDRGWSLASARLEQIQQAHDEAQVINQDRE